ncbi:ABC transporter substrate-binding protein [Candidatus Roseilinea sp. NK_OTU-006]|jgi:peptide/nickel transport system substrate-binding protein|uniref:ABC transporter substrate-binding protein n=1 Tax=Candidatus Roseilinea sp. NK_OTU-006 TaxID=2704250 RepID=UPI00145FBE04|nr:ABC transporter substrate-binding protein [Candidatus Roseilinea sp. NK_OTU-006]
MSDKKIVNRRQFLKAAALTGAGALLAACAPPSAPAAPAAPAQPAAPAEQAPAAEATKVPEAAAPKMEKTGEFHGAFPYQVPPTGHWNSFVPDGIPNGISIYWDLLEMPLARYRWAEGEYVPLMAKEWKFDGDNFVVMLREGAKWSDGNPFTAKDVVATFNMGRLFNFTLFNYVDDVRAKDDLTVEFHMNKPSTLVRRLALVTPIRSAATYGPIADKVAALVKEGKGKDSDEWKALLKEATEFRPEKLIVSGPYNIDPASITDASLTMNLNPTSWAAEKVNFAKIVLYNGETPVVTPLVLSGDIDYATHGFPPATEKEFVSQGIRIIRAPTYSGPAIYFNHDVYPLGLKEVRQAIAYSVKRDENGKVSLGDSGVPHKYMVGISDNLIPNWIEADALAQMNTYDYNPQKAEELLTGIGFKKGDDGVWVDDKGKKLEFELTVPAEFADWSAAAENLANQLNQAGFKITVRGVQFQQHAKDIPAGNFVMAIRGWGAGNPHPSFSWITPLFNANYVASTTGKGMNFPMKQKVGDQEVDLEQLITDSALGLDESAQKAAVTEVAKVFNELLPIVPLWERYGNNPALNVRVEGFPPDGDPIYKNAVYGDNFVVMMILDGTLRPKSG